MPGPSLRCCRLMKKVQRVVAVVDEIDTFVIRSDGKSEESARTCPARIDGLDGELGTAGSGFDNIAIPSVHRQNVAVRSDGHPKWLIQAGADRNSATRPRA